MRLLASARSWARSAAGEEEMRLSAVLGRLLKISSQLRAASDRTAESEPIVTMASSSGLFSSLYHCA